MLISLHVVRTGEMSRGEDSLISETDFFLLPVRLPLHSQAAPQESKWRALIILLIIMPDSLLWD